MVGAGQDRADRISNVVIGAAIEVHRTLGPGLLEVIYEECLRVELEDRGLQSERQVELPVWYKGRAIGCALRMDLLVGDCLVVEVKAIERLLPVHEAQLLTYLRPSGKRLGLLLNFNVPVMRSGIKRMVNNF
jgi:GxxExxY protein